MKKLMVVAVAMMIVVMAGSAMAATATGTMNVAASVADACAVSNITNLAFGALTGAAVNRTSTVTYKCTTGMAGIQVSLNDGANASGVQKRLSDGGTNYINYAASYAGGNLSGAGVDATFNIDGTITAGDAAAAVAGTYADQVTVTLTY